PLPHALPILMYPGWSCWVFGGKVRSDLGYHSNLRSNRTGLEKARLSCRLHNFRHEPPRLIAKFRRRQSHTHHDELPRWNDCYPLAVMPLHPERVRWYFRGAFRCFVLLPFDPDMTPAISRGSVGRLTHPGDEPRRQDLPSVPHALLQQKLAEACPVACRCIHVG